MFTRSYLCENDRRIGAIPPFIDMAPVATEYCCGSCMTYVVPSKIHRVLSVGCEADELPTSISRRSMSWGGLVSFLNKDGNTLDVHHGVSGSFLPVGCAY
jgi:hypothetical protein